ncbi:uncharacterized protein LOC114539469 isoform X2 [Dendronephthya gigantea]|uniref:uncharacterized protein LOC114539469 isoform X2 n=1 Tax=Dendronephthya gigantea TaxID=151771 RepID=UPI0010699F1F|nr:uncharacterized protein LOC114539469 isoform X2 [Dendronephthya gigantea]
MTLYKLYESIQRKSVAYFLRNLCFFGKKRNIETSHPRMADGPVNGNKTFDNESENVEAAYDDQNGTLSKKSEQLNSIVVQNIGQHSKSVVDKQHPNVKVMKDLRQNAVDLTDCADNHDKSRNKDHNQAHGTVDRRQSTVDTPNDLTDSVVNQNNDEIVDRNKATVEDPKCASNKNCGEIPGGSCTAKVDRNKATVEDTNGISNKNCGETPDGSCTATVDRNKATVEDTASTSNQVIHNKTNTVEDQDNVSDSLVDRRQLTVDLPSSEQLVKPECSETVDRNKGTVEDTTSEKMPMPSAQLDAPGNDCVPASCLVDRAKKTVEDTELSIQPSSANDDHLPEISRIQFQVTNASSQGVIDHLKNAWFKQGKKVVFGRGEGVDIFINDDGASRQHVELLAQILPNGKVSFMIRNISKTKGYHFNGKEITDNELWTRLRKGDQIKIAGLVFVVVDIILATTIKESFVVEFIHPHVSHLQPNPERPSNSYGGSTLFQSNIPPNNHLPTQFHNFPQTDCLKNITPDIVELEQFLQPYKEQKGHVKIKILCHLAVKAVGEWKELGRTLGLEDCQITRIDCDNQKVAEKSYQMLAQWVRSRPEQATYEKLKEALEDFTVGRVDLAKKYCTFENN